MSDDSTPPGGKFVDILKITAIFSLIIGVMGLLVLVSPGDPKYIRPATYSAAGGLPASLLCYTLAVIIGNLRYIAKCIQ